MPAAFGPVILATSRVTVMLVYAEETPSDFAREVPEGTRYVVKSVAAHPPFPGTFSCHLVWFILFCRGVIVCAMGFDKEVNSNAARWGVGLRVYCLNLNLNNACMYVY